ncbi:MAG: peptidylprolyl isomerase [Cyclobacteriaceae bacterium]|nr:peptidylprolyl isomerase [Cyclobacteriaceae bacterium]
MLRINVGYWDFLIFNRVIHNFIVQGGSSDTPVGFTTSRVQ